MSFYLNSFLNFLKPYLKLELIFVGMGRIKEPNETSSSYDYLNPSNASNHDPAMQDQFWVMVSMLTPLTIAVYMLLVLCCYVCCCRDAFKNTSGVLDNGEQVISISEKIMS